MVSYEVPAVHRPALFDNRQPSPVFRPLLDANDLEIFSRRGLWRQRVKNNGVYLRVYNIYVFHAEGIVLAAWLSPTESMRLPIHQCVGNVAV